MSASWVLIIFFSGSPLSVPGFGTQARCTAAGMEIEAGKPGASIWWRCVEVKQ